MHYINLLGNRNDEEDLGSFARAFFALAGIQQFEERESSNYAEDRYFQGISGDTTFIVALSDSDGCDDLPFWIHIKAEGGDVDMLPAKIDDLVRSKALPTGFRFARMSNFGKHDQQRLDY